MGLPYGTRCRVSIGSFRLQTSPRKFMEIMLAADWILDIGYLRLVCVRHHWGKPEKNTKLRHSRTRNSSNDAPEYGHLLQSQSLPRLETGNRK